MANRQIAERIAYLWHLRETDPVYYCVNRLGEEKEDLYAEADAETIVIAREIYDGVK